MAWLGKVTLGNLSDLAGAVTKLSESVKNIEKNFDSALGFDNKGVVYEAHQSENKKETSLDSRESVILPENALKETSSHVNESASSALDVKEAHQDFAGSSETSSSQSKSSQSDESVAITDQNIHVRATQECVPELNETSVSETRGLEPDERVVDTNKEENKAAPDIESQITQPVLAAGTVEFIDPAQQDESKGHHEWGQLQDMPRAEMDGDLLAQERTHQDSARRLESSSALGDYPQHETGKGTSSVKLVTGTLDETFVLIEPISKGPSEIQPDETENKVITNMVSHKDASQQVHVDLDTGISSETPARDSREFVNVIVKNQEPQSGLSCTEEKLPVDHVDNETTEKEKWEMQMMEAALKGAAKQAQTKADEISRLLLENDQLKSTIEGLKRKSSDVELDALREEYQQRLGAAERRVYALTKERDMLRREQNRKSDSSTLLKEKDEIIKQVMAEGEELSKKQAAQEAQMKKLRAQIRELEDEKQRLNSRLQVEEAKVESIRKDKATTEKLFQETVERGQAELATQKDFYLNSLNEAKEALARAEERLEIEAKADLDRRLHDATEREGALVQALEELRQSLSRTEHQAAFREDMLRKDIADLETRCQAAEVRYDELVARVPESTRPLLRQIEALQESFAMRAEAWSGLERAQNSRLQEAEANAAAAQERERAINERMTQMMSRVAVMEAQVSCLRAEKSQLTRSLEKERQRASETRQEYLAAVELAATQEGHVKQLEEMIKELKEKQMQELMVERSCRETLELELEKQRVKAAEGKAAAQLTSHNNYSPSKKLIHLPRESSSDSLEESYFLQASLNLPAEHMVGGKVRFNDSPPSPEMGRSLSAIANAGQTEILLRKKDGELALYAARLASLESTRDSLAEELVRTTTQCEQMRLEVASLPGLKAELDALRRRHASALELMGERDEEVEELRADLADVKQMYREQIDMLIQQIEKLSKTIAGK